MVYSAIPKRRTEVLYTVNDIFYAYVKYICPDGGIGRRAGLKIQWPVMAVPVRSRLRVQSLSTLNEGLLYVLPKLVVYLRCVQGLLYPDTCNADPVLGTKPGSASSDY